MRPSARNVLESAVPNKLFDGEVQKHYGRCFHNENDFDMILQILGINSYKRLV